MFSARIFVSYAHASGSSIALLAELEAVLRAEHTVLRDDQIRGGDAWLDQLATWLDQCDGALLLLCPQALESDFCRSEVEHLALRKRARRDRFALVPMLLDGVTWADVKEAFRVGDLADFQAAPAAATPEEVSALFRRVSQARHALFQSLFELPEGTVAEVSGRLALADEVPIDGSRRTQIEALLGAALRERKYEVLETWVADRRAQLGAQRAHTHPDEAWRPLVHALTEREPDPRMAYPELAAKSGLTWPPEAADWAAVVRHLAREARPLLIAWALPLEGLDTVAHCEHRSVLALLACSHDRASLLRLAALAGVRARHDERAADVWMQEVVRSASRSAGLATWLNLVAGSLPHPEVVALELVALAEHWQAAARHRDAPVHARIDALVRDLGDGATTALLDRGLEQDAAGIEAELSLALANVHGPPWQWRRGVDRARAILKDLSPQEGDERGAPDRDPYAYRWEAQQVLDAYRERSRSLRGLAVVVGWATAAVGLNLPQVGVFAMSAMLRWAITPALAVMLALMVIGAVGLPERSLSQRLHRIESDGRRAFLVEFDPTAGREASDTRYWADFVGPLPPPEALPSDRPAVYVPPVPLEEMAPGPAPSERPSTGPAPPVDTGPLADIERPPERERAPVAEPVPTSSGEGTPTTLAEQPGAASPPPEDTLRGASIDDAAPGPGIEAGEALVRADIAHGQWRTVVPQSLCQGACTLGSPTSEAGRLNVDEDMHEMQPPSAFQLLRTEVTQAQWVAVVEAGRALDPPLDFGLPDNPSHHKGSGQLPVENVSWCDAVRFANLWTLVEASRQRRADLQPVYRVPGGTAALEGCGESAVVEWVTSRRGYRLPTEWEWEIAARAAMREEAVVLSRTRFFGGDDETHLRDAGWFNVNSGGVSHQVATKRANGLGLYDMHGNVREWTWSLYDKQRPNDPVALRVYRGGAFDDQTKFARSALRDWSKPGNPNKNRGLRLVRASAPQ